MKCENGIIGEVNWNYNILMRKRERTWNNSRDENVITVDAQ